MKLGRLVLLLTVCLGLSGCDGLPGGLGYFFSSGGDAKGDGLGLAAEDVPPTLVIVGFTDAD